jgi:uncharacterized protein YjbJ (UPF0337 family)
MHPIIEIGGDGRIVVFARFRGKLPHGRTLVARHQKAWRSSAGNGRASNRTACYREQNIDTHVVESPNHSEETAMDKDRIKGSAEQTKGAVKEAAGKVFGDKKLETEGKTDKAAGKVQNAVGGLKDAMRGK